MHDRQQRDQDAQVDLSREEPGRDVQETDDEEDRVDGQVDDPEQGAVTRQLPAEWSSPAERLSSTIARQKIGVARTARSPITASAPSTTVGTS